ncbi:MAG: hypothetical protein JEZ00_21010 [Anaerolineaceae bacterium]|nr:hypothetical protein [Anaerolineaceae bacterium]
MDHTIKTEKYGIKHILNESWKLFRQNLNDILKIILCIHLPINIILALLQVYISTLKWNEFNTQIYRLIDSGLDTLFGTIATIAIVLLINRSLEEEDTSWHINLRNGFSKWSAVIATFFLKSILLAGLILMLGIPGIVFAIYYFFVIQVVVLRNLSWVDALEYSRKLVLGQWWHIAGITFLLGIIYIFIYAAILFPITQISHNPYINILPNTMYSIINGFFIVASTIFFLNTDYLRQSDQ